MSYDSVWSLYVYIYTSLIPSKSVHIFNCIFSMYKPIVGNWRFFFYLFLGLQWQQVLFILWFGVIWYHPKWWAVMWPRASRLGMPIKAQHLKSSSHLGRVTMAKKKLFTSRVTQGTAPAPHSKLKYQQQIPLQRKIFAVHWNCCGDCS